MKTDCVEATHFSVVRVFRQFGVGRALAMAVTVTSADRREPRVPVTLTDRMTAVVQGVEKTRE